MICLRDAVGGWYCFDVGSCWLVFHVDFVRNLCTGKIESE